MDPPASDGADLDRIFQRFARANPQRSSEAGGFGLGLAIVQAIATAHHGSVQVQSTPGRGSSFELVLPLGPAVAPDAAPATATATATAG
ncbi:MAG TPA: ATP-binding protein [Streptosporangiaceae bacterium]